MDLQSYGMGQITINNPGPGGSSTTTPTEPVVAATMPTILSISPSSVPVTHPQMCRHRSPSTEVVLPQTQRFRPMVNFIPVSSQSTTNITISLPSTFFKCAGSIQLVVSNPVSPVVQSNSATLTVATPIVSFSISPNSAVAGSPDMQITVSGSGFFPDSVVEWNTTALSTTYVNSRQLTAVIPASLISGFVQSSIQISTPENQGSPLPRQPFTTFLALPVNDIVYNPVDGFIYASIAGSAGEGLGNSIAGIDPSSGVVLKTIFVGSEPTRIALSSDGTQLFVGLNGAGAVRQVNLTAATAGIQFSLGGGPGIYNAPYVASGLAALPGQPNSVTVYGTNGVVTIFDSGVARAKSSSGLSTYFNQNYGGLTFGSAASTLYLNSQSIGSNLYTLTIDATGVTAATQLGSGNAGGTAVQYDNSRLYLSSGNVIDAGTGNQRGQFSTTSSSSTTPVAVSGLSSPTPHWGVHGSYLPPGCRTPIRFLPSMRVPSIQLEAFQ
jgi:hypothetical protein